MLARRSHCWPAVAQRSRQLLLTAKLHATQQAAPASGAQLQGAAQARQGAKSGSGPQIGAGLASRSAIFAAARWKTSGKDSDDGKQDKEQGKEHSRVVILIEAGEESGSPDLE